MKNYNVCVSFLAVMLQVSFLIYGVSGKFIFKISLTLPLRIDVWFEKFYCVKIRNF